MSKHTHIIFQLYAQPSGVIVRLSGFVCVRVYRGVSDKNNE